jgi:hypothetical protein
MPGKPGLNEMEPAAWKPPLLAHERAAMKGEL